MSNVIFGSGIVGLIAKTILSGNWDIIPFSRSRYYSFNPPLADNFIIRDAEIDQAVNDITGDNTTIFYRRCYSIDGQLVSTHSDSIANDWLLKIFGSEDRVPGQSLPYIKNRLTIPIYTTRINTLYQELQNKHLPYLKAEAAKGQVTEIGNHYYVRGGVRTYFDNAVSTIPLPALCKLMNAQVNLPAVDEHFVLVKSKRIDLEGHNQGLVVDRALDFYKVTTVMPNVHMFYFNVDIAQPGSYLLPIIGNVDIIDGTHIPGSIPAGTMPDMKWLADSGIFCIGSNAQWDWCADLGSNILRLVRYAARGYKYE